MIRLRKMISFKVVLVAVATIAAILVMVFLPPKVTITGEGNGNK